MRRSTGETRLSRNFFLALFSLKISVVAVLFVSSLVFVAGLTWEDDNELAGDVASDSDNSSESELGDVKLAGAGQQQLLNQLKNELGSDYADADVSMLQTDHGIHGEEAGVLRKAVPGMEDADEEGSENASEEEDDSDATNEDQEDEMSFIENGSADDKDNSEEADSEQEGDEDEASFMEQEEDDDVNDSEDAGSFHEDDDSEEERYVDPYASDALSYLQQGDGSSAQGRLAEEEDAPASFVQIDGGERQIRAHVHLGNHVARDRLAHAFNQDHVRLLDQTPVEEELLSEAAPGGGDNAVVSPNEDGPAEVESNMSEGEEGSASAPVEQASAQEAESSAAEEARSLDAEPRMMAAEPVKQPQGALPAEGMEPVGSQAAEARDVVEPVAKALEPEALEAPPAVVPPAETEEGTAAQLVEEMSKQDQAMQEAQPQEVLKRHTWQDMERTQDLRKNDVAVTVSGSQAVTAASAVALAGLLVGGQLLFSVGMC
ncbi:unnamed protein product [Neospora caninum Liverpool]|uniref:Rhoptry protein 6, putative n=1 Tax=Neospora caninum (strain Liverpool) TaxID=572307 RepID=F0VH02_NEOCL|nr:uncharacterized protein NCLIV_027850 [Neospora caninum Liverpool]CBZ52996.1 unnamed protein product [Neospora caninum Liverpool]CEL66981.1 TPA: rhoptry protein 6, putative [Neospora caninum Liverpool]|eukprot:XP_003883028.1 uncharacterized protein NCLIV_027850 [Neospora caninum Liverpool]